MIRLPSDHYTFRVQEVEAIINFLYCSPLSADTQVNLPCAFQTIQKTEKYLDPKTQVVKRRSRVSKNTIVLERLPTLVQLNHLKFKYVLWDSWFSSKENLDFVHHSLGKLFVVALKSNRTVALTKEEKRQGKFKKLRNWIYNPTRPTTFG